MPSFIHHFIQKVFPVYLLCSRPQAGSWGIQRWIRHSPGLSIAFNLKKCFKKHFRSCVMGLKDLNKMLSEPRGQRHKVGHKSWCGVSEAARELIQIHFSYNMKSYPSYPTNQPTLPFFFTFPSTNHYYRVSITARDWLLEFLPCFTFCPPLKPEWYSEIQTGSYHILLNLSSTSH